MTGQQLRNSILQEAIQGRLVPNVLEPGEKTGVELLQAILAERQKKENYEKGKKAKRLTLSTVEEEPWELPEGWCWCHIHDIAHTELGKMKDSEKNRGDFKPYLCTINVREDGIDLSTVKQMKFSVDECEHYLLRKGDLLICEGGDCGRCSIWEKDMEMYYQNSLHCVRFANGLSVWFFKYILDLYKYQGKCNGQGVGIKHFTQTLLRELCFPLPPLSIQKAIVDRIDVLFPLVDEYDKAAGELESLNKILPDKLRKSVLQEAIHGTLVPNDIPEGEATASELLQQILKERQDRENKEKGKKAKKLTLSTIEEEPWELPEGWCWCKLKDIGICETGTTPSKAHPEFFGGSTPFLSPGNIQDNLIVGDTIGISNEGLEYCRLVEANTILQVCIGGSIGKCAIVKERSAFNQQINSISPVLCNYRYVYYVLQTDYFYLMMKAKATGTATPIINRGNWEQILFPLPPLCIQHRIVEKIEEVFSTIDKLQS